MRLFTKLAGVVVLAFASHLAFAAQAIVVVDESGAPVANAQVMLGYAPGVPFAGNIITTGANGSVTAPAGWTSAIPVTAQAAGYIATTLPSVAPGALTVQVTHLDGPNEIEIKGNTNGFGTLDDDSHVHFGLVMPAIERAKFLSFDLSTIISPESDAVDVMGRTFNIPSNLTLPDQTVNYIFDIELNKPVYRAFVRNPGRYLLSATHGSFPVRKVVDGIRSGKPIFDMVNDFTFIEAGQMTVNVTDKSDGNDLSVNQTKFAQTVAVKAPSFPKNEVMMSLALDDQNGLMMPTDLKRFNANESMNLKAKGATPSVLSLLMVNDNAEPTGTGDLLSESPLNLIDAYIRSNVEASKPQNFSQMSFVMSNAAHGAAPLFLDLINPPKVDAQNVLTVNLPQAPAGVAPAGMYIVYSEILPAKSGSKVSSEQRTRLWEVWSSTWQAQIQLPKVDFVRNPNCKYRWEVMFLGHAATFAGGSMVNGVDLKSVTHVTRNTLDL